MKKSRRTAFKVAGAVYNYNVWPITYKYLATSNEYEISMVTTLLQI